ncbi:hypothetical protein Mycch_5658 (plasmid) [Mycolicibacterium chubuense NBB4]|uniref:Uncharacterized protein n=1 Tax=Mycolicibacterium chubuense (strain NBB4) TaxID=710421 RepID=I4BSN6_MYCCN|nr:Imm61 family immunity protein [Mycolicibacterium chubuense]AFM20293.1 hypothetical protein Mycch_5658 [Mycolicibacterium chubuense NBB4]
MGTDDAAGAHGPVGLSADCLGWARTAHYLAAAAEDGDLQLRSEAGAPTRYFVRRRGPDRLELTEAVDHDAEYPMLFVAEVDVLERYLVGLFADDIREDLDLPQLELSWSAADLADGYELSDMVRGYRTLKRTAGRPIAAAPDPTLSLLALVPLSHYMHWPIPDLKRSFLNPTGKPLLRAGRYAPRTGSRRR